MLFFFQPTAASSKFYLATFGKTCLPNPAEVRSMLSSKLEDGAVYKPRHKILLKTRVRTVRITLSSGSPAYARQEGRIFFSLSGLN